MLKPHVHTLAQEILPWQSVLNIVHHHITQKNWNEICILSEDLFMYNSYNIFTRHSVTPWSVFASSSVEDKGVENSSSEHRVVGNCLSSVGWASEYIRELFLQGWWPSPSSALFAGVGTILFFVFASVEGVGTSASLWCYHFYPWYTYSSGRRLSPDNQSKIR